MENLFGKILLVVEGADIDAAVTQVGIGRAVANKASLVVLHVVDHMVLNRMKRLSEQSTAEIEIELEEKGWKALYFAEELAKDQGVPTMILQKNGIVENEILNEAVRLKTDLIVLAYPRKLPGQAKRLSQGRVEKILENAPCSVLVVK
ncbi:MAG: universal stress protein [Kiritimatiellae bacterium]|nr:universal stress protein [Kiritimatiellia bacterium]